MLVAAITAAGLLLRLPSFADSLYGDELSTYYIVTGHTLGHIIYLLEGHSVDLNPPLFFMLAWVAERLGNGAQTLRLVSLLAGTSAIPLTYLLGLRTVGRRAAVVGAALMALSPMLIFFSSEARAYALAMWLVLGCTLCLLRALDTGRWPWWAAYAVTSCAAVYTQYIAVFFLGTLLVWAFLSRPDAWRPLFAANLAAAIAYIPWLPTLLKDTRSPGNLVIGFLSPLSFHTVLSSVARWSVGHSLLAVSMLPGHAAIAILVVGLAAAALGLALRARARIREHAVPRLSARAVLVLMLAFAPPAEILIYSLVGPSVWETRNLIVAWPGLALTVGALVTSAPGLLRVPAVALVIACYAIGAAKMLEPGTQRPNYDAAVNFIDRVGSPGDPVVDLAGPTPGPLTELDAAFSLSGRSQRHPVLRLGLPSAAAMERARPYAALPSTPAPAVIRQAAKLAGTGRLFFVLPRPAAPLLKPSLKLLPARFRRVETRTFAGLYPVSVYLYRGY